MSDKTTYYQGNRKRRLNRAKECYENNKEKLREKKQERNIENYLMEKEKGWKEQVSK